MMKKLMRNGVICLWLVITLAACWHFFGFEITVISGISCILYFLLLFIDIAASTIKKT